MKSAGKVRTKLAKLLTEALGFPVKADDIVAATGHWRTSKYADVLRWEGFVTNANGSRRSIGSWNTMTECVRNGVEIQEDRPKYGTAAPGLECYYLVSPKNTLKT